MGESFVHCHLHTEYSLLDGHSRIAPLMAEAARLGMPALAMTDHGAMYGAIEFYLAAKQHGLTPILGVEAYMAPRGHTDRDPRLDANPSHLILLATSTEGYRNLIALTTTAHLDGFYYKPRIDRELLSRHARGLIGSSACLQGEISRAILREDMAGAREIAATYRDIFGPGNFHLEMQNHGLADEVRVIKGMAALSRDLGIPLLGTNDVHYVHQEDADAQDALMCIQMNVSLDATDKPRMGDVREFYLKDADEMARTFAEFPEALRASLAIAERANIEIEMGRLRLPHFPVPAGETADSYLRALCEAGLRRIFGQVTPPLQERLDRELAVITQTGFAPYFLFVMDFVTFARARGILTTVRGSAAGSLVLYCCGVTDVDPIQYRLPFERFLNAERYTPPDVDIDFMDSRRDEVIRYVIEKYGADHVAQIITFGTMKARAAVRDVARVLQIPLAEADHIAKLIPNAPGFSMPIEEAVEKVAEIRGLYESGGIHRRLIESSKALEGLARHASVHAAGVVITPTELWNYVPLYRSEKSELTTQWDMHAVERAGLLKMDFLGLKTLTVLHYVVEDLQEQLGARLDLSRLPENDPETMKMLAEGKTEGVFQFEGNVPTDVLRRMKPDTFEDLVAVNALIRPGPLDSGMTDAFIRRKRGLEPIRYPHPDLQPILKNTYGVITYQEDVLKIAQVMAGFTLAQADVMRKAMGKKIQSLIDGQVATFVERAVTRGYDRRVAREVADQIVTFGRYGFNRAHAVGYTILSYQTAFLKRHYPRQYMAALLSSEMGNTDKVVRYIATCRSMGIDVLPPDINESRLRFTTVPDGIRFGLGAIKNVGHGAVLSILEARAAGGPFRSLFDLCERADLRLVNKRVLECLIMAGALDSLGAHRAQLLHVLESAIGHGARRQEETRLGQYGLFGEIPGGGIEDGGPPAADPGAASGGANGHDALPPLPDVPRWSQTETLQKEKELLGFYVSAHPLDRYRTLVRYFQTCETASLPDLAVAGNGYGPVEVVLAGMLTGTRFLRDRKGNPMAFATLEDFVGTAECILFSEVCEACRELLGAEKPVLVRGTLSSKGEDDLKVIAAQVIPLEQAARLLEIRVPRARVEAEPHLLPDVRRLLLGSTGTTPVKFCLTDGESESCCLSRTLQVAVTSRLLEELATRLGSAAIRLVSPLPAPRRPDPRPPGTQERGPRYAGSAGGPAPGPTGRGPRPGARNGGMAAPAAAAPGVTADPPREPRLPTVSARPEPAADSAAGAPVEPEAPAELGARGA